MDLLPTSTTNLSLLIWVTVLAVSWGLTWAAAGVSARVENEQVGWVTAVAPVVLVGLAMINVRLLIRARGMSSGTTRGYRSRSS